MRGATIRLLARDGQSQVLFFASAHRAKCTGTLLSVADLSIQYLRPYNLRERRNRLFRTFHISAAQDIRRARWPPFRRESAGNSLFNFDGDAHRNHLMLSDVASRISGLPLSFVLFSFFAGVKGISTPD